MSGRIVRDGGTLAVVGRVILVTGALVHLVQLTLGYQETSKSSRETGELRLAPLTSSYGSNSSG